MRNLIINPKKDQITKETVLLNATEIFNNLMLKVYQQEPNDDFVPVVTKDGHIRRFISNTDPINVSVQDYTGKLLETALEAKNYLLKIGTEIYGDPQWTYKLIINEVKYTRITQSYAMATDNDDLVAKITKGLDEVANIQYNKNKKKKEAVIETESDNKTAPKGQENSNE